MVIGVMLVLALAACAGGPDESAGPSTGASVQVSAPASVEASPAEGSPAATELPAPSASIPPVADLLPDDFDGVEAHTFPVAQDLVARLAARTGTTPDGLEAAYASEHGARFIQMLAIRDPAMPATELLDLLPEVAYGPILPEGGEVGTETLAGAETVRVHHPDLAGRLGTFYGLVRGEALIVVQAFEAEAAEAAISAIPAP